MDSSQCPQKMGAGGDVAVTPIGHIHRRVLSFFIGSVWPTFAGYA
jgi:hypothetical protein